MIRPAVVVMLTVFAAGCSEGTKANPLPRAGAPAVIPKVLQGDAAGKTLYERLGREEGLTRTADDVIASLAENPKGQPLSGKIKKRALVDFLMEAASRPRAHLADDLMLTSAEWAQVMPALRQQLKARHIPDAEVDELLANVEKSR